jgi:hypothetical protein
MPVSTHSDEFVDIEAEPSGTGMPRVFNPLKLREDSDEGRRCRVFAVVILEIL